MNFLTILINQAYAVGYFSQPLDSKPVQLPSFASLAGVERILLVALIVYLATPLMRAQKDPALEKERITKIKFAVSIGVLVAMINFYQVLSGT